MKTYLRCVILFLVAVVSVYARQLSRSHTLIDGYGNSVGSVTWSADDTTGVQWQTKITFAGQTKINNFPRDFRIIITLAPQPVSPTQSGLNTPGTSALLSGSTGYVPFYIYVNDGVSTVWGQYGPFTLAEPDDFRVILRLKNDRNYPVRYKLVQNGQVVGETTLQPGQAFIQSYKVPSGADVGIFQEVTGLQPSGDGGWREVPGAVYSGQVGGAVTPTNTGGGAVPPPINVPSNPNLPQSKTPTPAPNPAPRGVPVWNGGGGVPPPNNDPQQQVDLLTNATYRDGVDNINKMLDGDEVEQTEFTDPNTQDPVLILDKDPAESGRLKLPSAPTFSSMNSASTMSVNVDIPRLGGGTFTFSKTIDFGSPPYSGPVSIFRGALLVVLTLAFFVLSFFTVRSAFAGK